MKALMVFIVLVLLIVASLSFLIAGAFLTFEEFRLAGVVGCIGAASLLLADATIESRR